jgi:putative aldouronate transport system substrate-binding protein
MSKLRFVFALTALLAAGGLFAQAEPAWKKDTSPVTLNWYVNFSWYNNNWGESLISKYVQEKTGVKINFIVPAGNEAEKLNTMIASGTLPDIVTLGWWEDGVKKMIEGDLVYSLDELATKYDPAFKTTANPQLLGWYRQPDGKTYGYPNYAVTPSDYNKVKITSNQSFQVRKDIYEAIGKPDMRTPEGFLKALKAAKEKFPKVNGQPLIPIGFHEFNDAGNDSLNDYLQNFLAIPKEKNGKLYDRKEDPEYVRWLKTLRKANEQGLIAPDVFIDKRAQMEEKIAQGRYFAMLYQRTDMVQGQQALWDKDPNSAYIAVDGPANTKLEAPKLAGPGISGWTLSMISKNSKNAARAIAFFTYWISAEGQRDMYLGKKGETWDTLNGKDTYLPKYAAMKNENIGEFNKVVGQDPLWMFGNMLYQQQWSPATAPALKQMEDWTIGKSISYSVYDNLSPPADSDLGVDGKKANDKWGRTLPKLILAKNDAEFDTLYKAWLKDRNALSFDKNMEYQNKKLAENKAKLGIK